MCALVTGHGFDGGGLDSSSQGVFFEKFFRQESLIYTSVCHLLTSVVDII